MNSNEKYFNYHDQLSDLLEQRHEVQRRMENNRQRRHEMEEDLRQAIATRKPTDRIKQAIIELDQDYQFLQLENDAYSTMDQDLVLAEAKQAAIEEQKDQLIGYREQFTELEPQFEELRKQWMNLVDKACQIRHESIATQSRLTEIAGTKTYFPCAGDQINTIKGHEKGMIFLDNEIIALKYNKKRNQQ